MAEFKERLRELRKEQKIKQEELAQVLNYGYTAISNYESGRNEPSIKDLIKIANYFKVSMDYLIGRSDIRNYSSMSEDEVINEKAKAKLQSLEFKVRIGEFWDGLIQQLCQKQ